MTQAPSYLELFEVHTGTVEERARTYMMASQLGEPSAIELFEQALQRGDETVTFDRWRLLVGQLDHEGDHMIRTNQIVGVNECKHYTEFINWGIPQNTVKDAFRRLYGDKDFD